MKAEGSFPSTLRYRIPPAGEFPPAAFADERVLPFDYFGRRLGFALHSFVWEILLLFGCQLHHMNPTRILHIANFITFCEWYLGIAPTLICSSISSVSGYR